MKHSLNEGFQRVRYADFLAWGRQGDEIAVPADASLAVEDRAGAAHERSFERAGPDPAELSAAVDADA